MASLRLAPCQSAKVDQICTFFSLSFQIVKAMQRELANSGLSPEEILAKTMLLQKAMQGDQG